MARLSTKKLGVIRGISSVQMDEMMMGLQASGVRFLWVTRGQPHNMQDFSGDMGMVVPWCDQSRVLCHSSIGGFLTHCGWNSTLEGVFAGVPMLTFPLFWDQYPDSNDWKISVRLKSEEGEESVVGREEITKIVQKLMDLDVEESKELRERTGELKEASRKAVEEGGSSSTNLDAFIQNVVKCQRSLLNYGTTLFVDKSFKVLDINTCPELVLPIK